MKPTKSDIEAWEQAEKDYQESIRCPKCSIGQLYGGWIATGNKTSAICDKCGFQCPFTMRQCELCNRYDSVSNFFKVKNTYKHRDPLCRKRAQDNGWRVVKRGDVIDISEGGEFLDFLATLTFEEIDLLWTQEAWLDPSEMPGTSRLNEQFIKESIEKIRRIKFKNLSKS